MNDKNIIYEKKGNAIYFGSYPQTQANKKEADELSKVVSIDEVADKNQFSCCAFSDFDGDAKNVDVSLGGNAYRGMRFLKYRTNGSHVSKMLPSLLKDRTRVKPNTTYQFDNGFCPNKTYWFKFEPLRWKILASSPNKALLFCDCIIYSNRFYRSFNEKRVLGDAISYSNDYELSDVRKWLNEVFLYDAFDEKQREAILTSDVSNGAASVGKEANRFVCNDTSDKIFLLSYEEATRLFRSVAERKLKPTDYAKANGCFTDVSNGNGYWWLRSPHYDDGVYARTVKSDGDCLKSCSYTDNVAIGIAPALWIKL